MNKFKLNDPDSLRKLNSSELKSFVNEFRTMLIESYASNGGYISSGLSVLDISLAICYLFNLNTDLLLVDNSFNTDTLDKLYEESSYSLSIKYNNPLIASIPYIKSNRYSDKNIIIVQDYKSLVKRYNLALLSSINELHKNIIIISYNYSIEKKKPSIVNSLRVSDKYINIKSDLRDNLSSNKLGTGLLNSLSGVKSIIKKGVIHDNNLNNSNIDFFVINNGNNISTLINTLKASQIKLKPIILNCYIKPSYGYSYYNDISYLNKAVEPFNVKTGKPKRSIPHDYKNIDEIVLNHVLDANPDNYLITLFDYPTSNNRIVSFVDSNDDYVDLAVSLLDNNKKVLVLLNSTQISHTYPGIMKLFYNKRKPVILINEIGIKNNEEYNKHGINDLGILLTIPTISIAQGVDVNETLSLVDYLTNYSEGAIIRYPSIEVKYELHSNKEINSTSWETYGNESNPDFVIIGYGHSLKVVIDKVTHNNLPVLVINARFIKPLDTKLLNYLAILNKKIVVYEDNYLSIGLSSMITNYYNDIESNTKITRIGISDTFIRKGSIIELKKELQIDSNHLFTLLLKEREYD